MCFFFFQAEDGIRDIGVTGVQTCALPISSARSGKKVMERWRTCSGRAGGRSSSSTLDCALPPSSTPDRERGVLGKSVDLGGRRIIKKKKTRSTILYHILHLNSDTYSNRLP